MPKMYGTQIRVFLVLMIVSSVLWAQEDEKQDLWAPFEFFVGQWEGKVEGKYGQAKIEQKFEFVLSGEFLRIENKTTFEPTEKKPKGEVHQDLGFFSYDENREKFVFRQFHVEGFVNQYVLDKISEDGKTLVFITESIENISAGWRAKLTYKILDEDEFGQIFELAPPGKDFAACTQGYLKRKR